MIDGIRIEMTTAQVKTHVNSRVEFHEGKIKWYGDQIAALEKGGLGARSNVSNDPVSSLQSSMRQHEKQAAYFRILRDHLIPNEVYRLSETDLSRLELASQYYGG